MNKGFTLVELIVTITILAILGTIAFISLSGFGETAKNSKIISDMRTLVSTIETKSITGEINLGALVGTPIVQYSVANGINTFGSESFGGTGEIIDENSNYDIGTIDFGELRQSEQDFYFTTQDGIKREYLVANAKKGRVGYYQLAATLNNREEGSEVILKGNYINEGGINDVESLFSDSGSVTPIETGQNISPSEFLNPQKIDPSESITLGGASPGPAGAIAPYTTWTATPGDTNIYVPESNAYNIFQVNPSANNADIQIEIGNENATITTQFGDDQITAGYGNNLIDASNGNNIISVGDGYNEIEVGYQNSTITVGNGDNVISSLGGEDIINAGNGDNTITLGYGNPKTITLGNGNNTIDNDGGGALHMDIGDGNNTIESNGFGDHIINFGNGDNTLTGVGGNSIVTTGTGGSANITFGGNQAQRLIWRGGDIVINDFWRWGNNRISFENISDINNCSDVSNNTIMNGSIANITSTQGLLEIRIQNGQTDLNCNSTMIF